jgi:hypothetical protein
MECVKGSDLAMNGSDDLERARSRDIVAKHTFEQLGPAAGMRHAVGISNVKSLSVDLSGTAGCRIEAAIYEIGSSPIPPIGL